MFVAIGGVLFITIILGVATHYKSQYGSASSDIFQKLDGPKTNPVQVARGTTYKEEWVLYAYRLVDDRDSVCLQPQVTRGPYPIDLEKEQPVCAWNSADDDMADFSAFNVTQRLNDGKSAFTFGPLRGNVVRVVIHPKGGRKMIPQIVSLPKDVGAPKAFIMPMSSEDALRVIDGEVEAYDAQGRKVPIGPPHP